MKIFAERKQLVFQIILGIVALDYIVIGVLTMFGTISNDLITPMFGVLQIIIGIYLALLLTDVRRHKTMIWGAVIAEIIIAASALINTITSEVEGELAVFFTHLIYLIAITISQYEINYNSANGTDTEPNT